MALARQNDRAFTAIGRPRHYRRDPAPARPAGPARQPVPSIAWRAFPIGGGLAPARDSTHKRCRAACWRPETRGELPGGRSGPVEHGYYFAEDHDVVTGDRWVTWFCGISQTWPLAH